jgi:hypothetical protein
MKCKLIELEDLHGICLTDTPKASPRISSKVKGTSKEASKDGAGPSASSRHSIVVVAEGSSKNRPDSELVKLDEVPAFYPFIKASLNVPAGSVVNQIDSESLERLDTEQVILLCQRYQEHLKQCSEAVAFDQNALCVRIKEVCTVHPFYLLFGNLCFISRWILLFRHYTAT